MKDNGQGTNWSLGLSPHAPYSVHPELLRKLVDVSRHQKVSIAMHLAESREEIEWVENRTGPFREMLESLNACYPDSMPSNYSIQAILELLANARRLLLIHGNYLTNENIELIARYRNQMSVVYCPRTCHFFGHVDHPFRKLIEAGIQVALGTDSRASNPDLNLWAEGQFLSNEQGVDPVEVLNMMTINGANAMGIEKDFGTIEVGKVAAFSVLESGSVSNWGDAFRSCEVARTLCI